MGQTITEGKSALKDILFVAGLVPGSIRGYGKAKRKYLPNYSEAIDNSTPGSLILGESEAHDLAFDSVINAFEGQTVSLTATELKDLETKAREFSDAEGVDYQVAFSGMKASALEQKKLDAKAKTSS